MPSRGGPGALGAHLWRVRAIRGDAVAGITRLDTYASSGLGSGLCERGRSGDLKALAYLWAVLLAPRTSSSGPERRAGLGNVTNVDRF